MASSYLALLHFLMIVLWITTTDGYQCGLYLYTEPNYGGSQYGPFDVGETRYGPFPNDAISSSKLYATGYWCYATLHVHVCNTAIKTMSTSPNGVSYDNHLGQDNELSCVYVWSVATPSPTPSPTLPTIAPSVPPTKLPSQSPTMSPTIAPTSSCFDYKNETSDDGNDEIPQFMNNYDAIVNINNYYTNITADVLQFNFNKSYTADHVNKLIECNDDCIIQCDDSSSCLLTDIEIKNITNKTVVLICDQIHSCSSSSLAVSAAVSALNITIVCIEEYACINMDINVTNTSSFNLYCIQYGSCLDINININIADNMHNANDGIISCIALNACDNLVITTSSNQTQLIMYQYSHHVILNNNVGYLKDQNNILCNNDRYIRVESNQSLTTDYFSGLVRTEYDNNLLPCADVKVLCGNYSCSMTYYYPNPQSVTTPIQPNSGCYWLNIQHVQKVICEGQCISSPTSNPTFSPTRAPTLSPSISPTTNPTLSPSTNPSFNPSISPTSSPTASPTISPTTSPTRKPSFAPSLYPSFSPTISPTATPSMNPTFAPSVAPTFPPSVAPTFAPTIPPSNSPSNNPTSAPSSAPSNVPSAAPTISPSKAPTLSPTAAPTRIPTQDYETIYHSYIDICYVIQELSPLHIVELEDNTVSVLGHIIEIIESKYFVENVVEYKDFMVKVDDINGFEDLSNVPLKKGQDIKLHSQILSGSDVDGVLLRTSKKDEFESGVTMDLQANMFENNANLKFYVEDRESLKIYNDNEVTETESYGIIVLSALIVCIGLLCSAFIKWSNKRPNAVIDNAKWRAPLLFALQIYDFISDIYLCYDILSNELMSNNDLRATIILWCGIFATIFTVLPFLSNVMYGIRIKKQRVIQNNRRADEYFTANIAIFMAFIVVSGGCHPALLIVSSAIYGLNAFQSGLTKNELNKLTKIKIKSTITLENVPQLIVQIIYATQTTSISTAVFLAFIGSVLSIILALSSFFANRENRKNSEIMSYYLRFCNGNCNKLEDEQERNIQENKGRREKLQKAMSKVFGVSPDNIEIGYVWTRKDGVEMYVSHYFSKSELAKYNQNIRGYMSSITPKQYLTDLYKKMKVELNKTFRIHFDIESEDFLVEMIHSHTTTVDAMAMDDIDHNISVPLTQEIELQSVTEYTEGATNKSLLTGINTTPAPVPGTDTNAKVDEMHNMMQSMMYMMRHMDNQENEKKDEEIDISAKSNGSKHSVME